MGQAGFTIAGQVIGAYFGGPVGAAIGGAIGSYIGGALFNEDQVSEGQRLADLKVQASNYGGAVPILYGSGRIAGNLIWCSDMRETRTEEDVSQSAKGGPSATQILYSYDIDVAVALCEGEIVGIQRIYANGILIYDKSTGVDPATVYASGLWATGLYVYTGSETQLPDPTIEAAVGVGNAQAYRGTAYVVITGLQLNTLKTASIPNFEFVVVQSGTPTQYAKKFETAEFDPGYANINFPTRPYPYVRVQQGVVRIWGQTARDTYPIAPGDVKMYDLNGAAVGIGEMSDYEINWPDVIHPETFGTATQSIIIEPPATTVAVSPGALILSVGDSDAALAFCARLLDRDVRKIKIATTGVGTEDADYVQWIRVAGGSEILSVDEGTGQITVEWNGDAGTLGASYFYAEQWGYAPAKYAYSNGVQIRDVQVEGGLLSNLVTIGGTPERVFNTFVLCSDRTTIIALMSDYGAAYSDAWVRFRYTGSGYVVDDQGSFSLTSGERVEYYFNGMPTSSLFENGGYNAGAGEADGRWFWLVNASGLGDVVVCHIDDDGVGRVKHRFSFSTGDGVTPSTIGCPAVFADNGLCYIVIDKKLFCYSREGEIESTGLPLSEVVADLCDRSGIDAAELDVTDLTQTVRGYVIGQMMTGRNAIESLRPVYYFDAVDGDKLKFVNRGGAAVADFAYDDIGLESDQHRVASDFTQETERPARVNVRYLSQGADYQVGAQSARRETTSSRETLGIDVPVVLEDNEAAQAADINLRDKWASAARRTWKSSLEYSHIEPTDVVTVDDGVEVRTVRVVKRTDNGLLIEWEGLDEDATTYDSNAIAAPVIVPVQEVAINGPTDVEVLDLPPLTDSAASGEMANYFAVRGILPGWSSAAVDISRNAGSTYSLAATISTASIMGVATTALGDFTAGNVFDESNVVRVSVSGALTSITHDEVLAGGNPCVIGDEILQFREADLVSAGVYDLSGLLRGRKGTEWAIGEHAAGERFVMLTTSLGNLSAVSSDRNSPSLRVRATSSGASPANSESESFETQLARLMPYSPAHLSAVKSQFGSWTLTWVRRDRYMNDWRDGADVPMSEETERYDVEVYDANGDLAASYVDLTSATAPVPSSVLGPAAASINFSVWQKSSVVGRGFEANAEIDGATGIGTWRQSTDTSYLAYVKGMMPNDLPQLPLSTYGLQTVYQTRERLRYTGFVVDVQESYTAGISGGRYASIAMYDDDDSDGTAGDHVNILYRSEWTYVYVAKDDAVSTHFFASYVNGGSSYIIRFEAVDAATVNWSNYEAGLLGAVTRTSLASTYFTSLVSIGSAVFAYYSGGEAIYKFVNTTLATTTSWAKTGAGSTGKVFKNGTDLWFAFNDEIAKINQTTGAETLNFTVADDITDVVAVGGYAYVYLQAIEKVKKYELATGTVQAFEYDYSDNASSYIASMKVLEIDGTLLSIGRAYVDALSGEYIGTIVVVDTTTDEII